jgi:hypothetical protein
MLTFSALFVSGPASMSMQVCLVRMIWGPSLLIAARTVFTYSNFFFTRAIAFWKTNKISLETSQTFPWAALTRLQAAKFFSDMVESLIGAVFLDTGGDFEVVRLMLRRLGILPVLERIVEDNVDVQHPVSRLSLWASARQKKVVYSYSKEFGKTVCTVALHDKDEDGQPLEDGVTVCQVAAKYRGKRTEMEARFVAAERAMSILDSNPHEELVEDIEVFLDLDPDDEGEEEDVRQMLGL